MMSLTGKKMTKAQSKKADPPVKCPGCGCVITTKASIVPFDPEGCIVLRNKKGIGAKCRSPLDRDCVNCVVWISIKDSLP